MQGRVAPSTKVHAHCCMTAHVRQSKTHLQLCSSLDRGQLPWQLLDACIMGFQLLQDHAQQGLFARAHDARCLAHCLYLATCTEANSQLLITNALDSCERV